MKKPKKPFLKVLKIILIVWLVCLVVRSFLPSVYYKVAFFLTYPLHVWTVEFIDENTQGKEWMYIEKENFFKTITVKIQNNGVSKKIKTNISAYLLINFLPDYYDIIQDEKEQSIIFTTQDYIGILLFNRRCGIAYIAPGKNLGMYNINNLENIIGNWYYYEKVYDTSKLPG